MVFCRRGWPTRPQFERPLAGVEAMRRGHHVDELAFDFTGAAAVGSGPVVVE